MYDNNNNNLYSRQRTPLSLVICNNCIYIIICIYSLFVKDYAFQDLLNLSFVICNIKATAPSPIISCFNGSSFCLYEQQNYLISVILLPLIKYSPICKILPINGSIKSEHPSPPRLYKALICMGGNIIIIKLSVPIVYL